MKSFGQGMRLIDDGIMRLIVRAVRGAADIFNRRPVLAPKVFRCGIHPPPEQADLPLFRPDERVLLRVPPPRLRLFPRAGFCVRAHSPKADGGKLGSAPPPSTPPSR
jgi:hypothetical protein